MTRPLVADALPVLRRISHAEALHVLVDHRRGLVREHGEWEVAVMFSRHLWALLGDGQR